MATMKQSLLEQAETMRSVAEHMPREVQQVLQTTGTGFRKIYLIGSGTSLNAAHVARCLFEQRTGAEVAVVTPFDFLNYFPRQRIGGDTLVLGISQTARSTGTISAMEISRGLGAKTVFVTAEPENEGAKSADAIFNTWTGLELVGAKTKGFTSTIAALLALASGLGSRELALAPLAGALDQALQTTREGIAPWVEDMLEAKAIKIISYGPCMGIAKEAALKIIETIRIPAEVYDVEEYMHGPYHMLAADSRLLFLCPPGAGQERAGRMLSFAQGITPHTFLLADADFAAPFGGHKLPMPALGDESLDSVSYIVPAQWLANDVTLRLGRKPEASAYPQFHKILGSKHMPKVNYYTGEQA